MTEYKCIIDVYCIELKKRLSDIVCVLWAAGKIDINT